MVSIFVAFLIPFNLMEKKRRRKSRIVAGVAGLILFFQSINPQFIADQQANLESGGYRIFRFYQHWRYRSRRYVPCDYCRSDSGSNRKPA